MYQKKVSKFSRRDLFKGFMGHIRGQDMEGSSGLGPDVFEADRLLKDKKYEEAAKAFEACLENEPSHEEALRKLGYCHLKLSDTGAAREVWKRVMNMRPSDPFSVLYTGLSHAMDGNSADAVAAWKKYFNIKQPHIQREINLILALHERGDELDPSEMVKSVQEAILKQKKG
ncbi:MAG: hypothetical protein D5R98_05165 [Desulfonatronovibrio sp. MSAO_Bac4]|nr:MAG: hypothetical protein D5R98_05165 [Desulfonatronovibrio sp. MSAO_Bac4]